MQLNKLKKVSLENRPLEQLRWPNRLSSCVNGIIDDEFIQTLSALGGGKLAAICSGDADTEEPTASGDAVGFWFFFVFLPFAETLVDGGTVKPLYDFLYPQSLYYKAIGQLWINQPPLLRSRKARLDRSGVHTEQPVYDR